MTCPVSFSTTSLTSQYTLTRHVTVASNLNSNPYKSSESGPRSGGNDDDEDIDGCNGEDEEGGTRTSRTEFFLKLTNSVNVDGFWRGD